MISKWSLLNINVDSYDALFIDCFDTLFHREVFQPTDVFSFCYSDPIKRISSEDEARKLSFINSGSIEICIRDIIPNYKKELQAEKELGFLSPSIVGLIKLFNDAGKPVVVISDTYLTSRDLKFLLGDLKLEIFVSCELGVGKGKGLFDVVIEKLNLRGKRLIHIGDNVEADIKGAKASGIPAMRYEGYQDAALDVLSSLRETSLQEFHRVPRLEIKKYLLDIKFTSDLELFGYALLGPIVSHFLQSIEKQAKGQKVTFFGRDTKLIHDIYQGPKQYISINREIAWQCSFYKKQDIIDYLVFSMNLLPEDRINHLLHDLSDFDYTYSHDLIGWALNNVEEIIRRSAIKRKSLKKHLELFDLKNLFAIDLGYSGTINKRLNIILREEYKIFKAPDALFLLSHPSCNTKSIFKVRDDLTYKLLSNVSILETCIKDCIGPLKNYDAGGAPIHADYEWDNVQREMLNSVRSGIIIFYNTVGPKKFAEAELYLTQFLLHIPNSFALIRAELGLGSKIYSQLKVSGV